MREGAGTKQIRGANLIAPVAVVLLVVGGCGSGTDHVIEAGSLGGSAAGPMQRQSEAVPGAGDVDRVRGPMIEVAPFRPTDTPDGWTVDEPFLVGHPTDESLRGWVEWDDMYPTFVPISDAPAPMVPIRDDAGRQIAWWANGLGWVSFDEVSAPGFDYEQAYEDYLAESSDAEDRMRAEGRLPELPALESSAEGD